MTPCSPPVKSTCAWWLAAGIGLGAPPCLADRVDLIEPLLGPAAVAGLRVSPDGSQVAYFSTSDSVRQIVVAPLERPHQARSLAPAGQGDPVALHWLPRSALLAIERDGAGERWRIIPLAPAGDARVLFEHQAAATRGPRFLGIEPSGDILLSLDRDRPWRPDAFRLDPASGALRVVETNPGDVFAWLPTPDGDLKLARRWRRAGDSVRYEVVFRPRAGARWCALTAHRLEQPEIRPLGFAPDGAHFYLARELRAGRQQIRRLDAADGRADGWSLVVEAEQIAGLRHDRAASAPALIDLESERPGRYLLHPPWRAALVALAERAPRGRARLAGSGAAGSLWLVDGDREPGGYFLVRGGSIRAELALRPALDGESWAAMRPFSFIARDGQRVGGYWTGTEDGPRPTVLRIHGGPWSRDRWGWNAEVQWLARLGYQVLQVNFRGSRGISHGWLQQGRRQWGRAMQRDLEDALRWAVDAGIADPARICAMGGSYGGYAALMLMTADSRPLRCAVARAPVTDLAAQIDALQRRGNSRGHAEWVQMVGDPRTDASLLAAHSPLPQAARIDGPVLLAHGTADAVVDISGSLALVDALKSRGREVEWLPLPEQGHERLDAPRRRAYYRAVSEFLSRHLGD